MSLTSFIVKRAIPYPKIDSFDRYLFIGPHPDDIEIGAGATVAKLVAMGKDVSFLICLDGRFGGSHVPTLSERELINMRKEEAICGANRLGVKNVFFLDLCDGGFYTDEALQQGIAHIISEVGPNVIFAPDPDEKSECHMDHLRVGRVCKEFTYFSKFENIMKKFESHAAPFQAIAFYMTAHPTKYFATHGYLDTQLEAIRCHASQYPENHPDTKDLCTYLKLRAITYGLKNGSLHAEGFRILNATQMHCLPEM